MSMHVSNTLSNALWRQCIFQQNVIKCFTTVLVLFNLWWPIRVKPRPVWSRDFSTSGGIATSQLKTPAIPPANSVRRALKSFRLKQKSHTSVSLYDFLKICIFWLLTMQLSSTLHHHHLKVIHFCWGSLWQRSYAERICYLYTKSFIIFHPRFFPEFLIWCIRASNKNLNALIQEAKSLYV